MKLKIVIAIVLLAAMAGCKSKAAFDYSQRIVKMEKDLAPEKEKADLRMSQYIEVQNYDSVMSISSRMESLVNDKLNEIKKLDAPNVPKAENFKRAAIRFFSFMKSMYTAFKSFASQTNEEEREKERQKLVDIAGRAEDAVKEIQKVQKEYADANNFKIRPD